MKSVLFASAFALVAIASAAPTLASDNGMRPGDKGFGPTYEMTIAGHAMHIHAVQDKKGAQWIVVPRAEFEGMAGHGIDLEMFHMDGH